MNQKTISSCAPHISSHSNSKNLRILVTAIGGRAAYNFVRCLKESDLGKRIYFIGADMSRDSPKLLCDEFVSLPHSEDGDYISKLQKIIQELNVDLVIPTSDEECLALAKNRSSISNVKTLPIGRYEDVLSAKDKFKLYDAAKNLGVVPVTACIKKGSSIAEIRNLVGLPAFLKPRMGRGGRHTHAVRDDSDAEAAKLNDYWKSFRDDFGTPVCQPFIESSDYGLDAYVNSSGKIIFGATRKKLKVVTGDRIVGMGSVSVREPEMEAACRKIIEFFGLKGLIELEMRKDSSGKIYVFDVNPRVGGSIFISKASGRNIAMLPILDYLNEPYPKFEYAAGVEIVRREIEKNSKKFFWDFVASKKDSGLNGAELPEVA